MREAVAPFLLVPAGFIVFGLLFVFLGIRGGRGAKAFRARAARASGLVTEVRDRWDHDTVGAGSDGMKLRRYPVVRFSLPDGREVETETPGANPAPAKAGAQVTVLYDPQSPTEAVIDTRWGDGTVGSGCITVFGIVFALIGALFLAGGLALMSLD